MTEMFDVVDENDNVIGKATREECHTKGLLHRGVYIFIFNSKGELLLQKRSMNKDLYKGLWDGSASGHVEAGNGYEEAARQELKEELGIEIELKFLFKYNAGFGNDIEIDSFFIGFHDGPFNHNEKEIDDIKFLSIEELKKLIKENQNQFSPGLLEALKEYGKRHET